MLFSISPVATPDGYGDALVPIDDLKLWLRVEDEGEDALIEALRDAAIDMVEQYCNLRLGPVTGLVARFDSFGARMRVGVGPTASLLITAIDFIDGAGAAGAIATGGWRVDALGTLLASGDGRWPDRACSVAVTFNAGFPDGACPAALRHAVKMFVAHLYKNREAVVSGVTAQEVPMGVIALCNRYRMPVI